MAEFKNYSKKILFDFIKSLGYTVDEKTYRTQKEVDRDSWSGEVNITNTYEVSTVQQLSFLVEKETGMAPCLTITTWNRAQYEYVLFAAEEFEKATGWHVCSWPLDYPKVRRECLQIVDDYRAIGGQELLELREWLREKTGK